MIRTLSISIALTAVLAVIAPQARADEPSRTSGGLFYNYYVPPVQYGGVGASLYPSPRPTPPLVGHTYVTYQPLMPHEFLYPHHRTYVRRNPGAGFTTTSVTWRRGLFSGIGSRHGPRVLPSPPLPRGHHR